MTASLMMYLRPELAEANDRFWALIRANLRDRGVDAPRELDNAAHEFDVWTNPELVLSQTCGMPYRLLLHDRVALVGTPDYGLDCCQPGYYRSAIVVRADDPRQSLNEFRNGRFAFNQTISQSGFSAPYAHCMKQGFWFADRVPSGQHLQSARMVAQGTADITSLDAVTWRLIENYEAFSSGLRVLDWTDPTPGLPLITAKTNTADTIREAVRAAILGLDAPDRNCLGLRDIVAIDKSAYLAVKSPPADIVGPLPILE